MIRVLWCVPSTSSWIGGLNYFINLGNGIRSLSDPCIEPIILGSPKKFPDPLNTFDSLSKVILYNKDRIRYSPSWVFHKLRCFLSGTTNPDLIRYLQKNNIDLFSHGSPLGKKSPIPALCWIPDFQHRHLPEFFSRKEIRNRNKEHQLIAEQAHGILFSSEDARNDFNRFHPGFSEKTYVLHFISTDMTEIETPAFTIISKYLIDVPFFHVPNQIWAHKNHIIILEALQILKSKGLSPVVISTGHTEDYRNPDYFTELKQKIDDSGLKYQYRLLGLIDYSDVKSIMGESICIINPSLFEGWSTTVEEAKSLGKRILLSDIPVHREQNPERGSFFNPYNPQELADLMEEVLLNYNHQEEIVYRKKAAIELPARIQLFARQYEEIVLDVYSKFHHPSSGCGTF